MFKPVLESDEREVATYRANRSQGSRAVGGHLLLTDRRLIFYPHKVDRATGGNAWECRLTALTDVGLSERGRNPFDGSLRRRLKVGHGGSLDLFVVNKAEAVAAAIRSAASL